MMAPLAHLSREERIGLGVAAAAHVALFAVLAFYDKGPPNALAPPERMTVSLADEVSLQSTAPDPAAQPQVALAPELAPEQAPAPVVQPPAPEPQERSQPEPPPRPAPEARPSPRPTPSPSPRPDPPRERQPEPRPSPSPTQRSGGPRVGSDFLAGASSGERSEQGTPAASFGPAEQASLAQAINRQLKPHWNAPQGVDAELLVTVLRWELNRDGSLKGTPQVVSQSGITDSNRPQAKLHAERAIRSVQLAAPFDLPEEFYDRWRRVTSWRFDRKL